MDGWRGQDINEKWDKRTKKIKYTLKNRKHSLDFDWLSTLAGDEVLNDLDRVEMADIAGHYFVVLPPLQMEKRMFYICMM